MWQNSKIIHHYGKLFSDGSGDTMQSLLANLPNLLLNKLKGGDFTDRTYQHVIVDEFQDLTLGEQQLFLELKDEEGKFVALGDPRQSIYAF